MAHTLQPDVNVGQLGCLQHEGVPGRWLIWVGLNMPQHALHSRENSRKPPAVTEPFPCCSAERVEYFSQPPKPRSTSARTRGLTEWIRW